MICLVPLSTTTTGSFEYYTRVKIYIFIQTQIKSPQITSKLFLPKQTSNNLDNEHRTDGITGKSLSNKPCFVFVLPSSSIYEQTSFAFHEYRYHHKNVNNYENMKFIHNNLEFGEQGFH